MTENATELSKCELFWEIKKCSEGNLEVNSERVEQ
jgi:hypothetical protein